MILKIKIFLTNYKENLNLKQNKNFLIIIFFILYNKTKRKNIK